MKAAELFVKALEAEGVEYIFAVPGEENLDMLEALRKSGIRVVVTRHEQGAGFMAATYGRLTGRAGVCLSTLGPGATNLITAAAHAQLGGMPMVMITGQKPIKAGMQGAFQMLDVVRMMEPVTKYARQLWSAGNVPARVREAFRLAQEERPGAVHLELPEDIAREETDAPLIPASQVERPCANPESIAEAARLIQEARCPILLLGAGANRQQTCEALSAFVDQTRIPFLTTQMGKGVIDERHPCYLGTAALSSNDFLHRAIKVADLIVNAGHDVVEKPPFIMGRHVDQSGDPEGAAEAGSARVIHLNHLPARVDAIYHPHLGLIGDITTSIEALTRAVAAQPHWDFARVHQAREGLDAHLRERVDDGAFPMVPQRIVADVRRSMPDDGIVALDNGIYKIWFARNYRAYQPNTVLLDNALATMGAGLPAAMAARLVHSDRKILAVCGDGGFMMNSQELETAVRLDMSLVVLILRDGAYGMVRWKQQDMGFDDFGLRYGNPDFVQYAESYGAHGHRVVRATDLAPLLRECLEASGVHVIDLPVDYSDNERVLSHEIPELSRTLWEDG
ncbi:MAG TPA: acetolactate synthase large subunit [Gemmatimonadales bacterium]|nr:acetolactate synthase large subunit [Gemmatimonadales bacterium]